jgi:hypothetical protein
MKFIVIVAHCNQANQKSKLLHNFWLKVHLRSAVTITLCRERVYFLPLVSCKSLVSALVGFVSILGNKIGVMISSLKGSFNI